MIRLVAFCFGVSLFVGAQRPAQAQFQPTCIKNISHVAKRLGVRPTTQPSVLVAADCNGRNYDIVALIDALLDRMDRQARAPRPIEEKK